MPTRGEAESNAETGALRLVETSVQRLLGVGQARSPGGQRIRAIARELDRVSLPPERTSRLAPRDPLSGARSRP